MVRDLNKNKKIAAANRSCGQIYAYMHGHTLRIDIVIKIFMYQPVYNCLKVNEFFRAVYLSAIAASVWIIYYDI